MRLLSLPPVVAIAALAGLASAQCFDSIASCAQSCIRNALSDSTSCASDDWECMCTGDNLEAVQDSAENCEDAACGKDLTRDEIQADTEAFCAAVNANETCTVTATTSTTTTSSSSSSATTTGSSTTSSTTSGTSSATTGTAATETSSTTAGTATGSTTSSTGGAAAMGSVGSLGMAALGLLFLF